MSKPAVLFQKPKPWAILARARFCAALWAAATASPTTTTSSAACSAQLPKPREKRRRGRATSARAISAIGRPVAAATHSQATWPSANGQTVLQAALGPQRVEAARDLQRRALADVALKNFAVIADRLDDAIGPVVGEPEPFTELAFEAEQAADFRIGGVLLIVDIGLVDAELFGVEHRMVGPAHDVFPGVIALAHRRAQRLLGDDFRQHDVGAGIGQQHARAIKPGRVGGVGIAAAGI